MGDHHCSWFFGVKFYKFGIIRIRYGIFLLKCLTTPMHPLFLCGKMWNVMPENHPSSSNVMSDSAEVFGVRGQTKNKTFQRHVCVCNNYTSNQRYSLCFRGKFLRGELQLPWQLDELVFTCLVD